jgi:hypothetical protein
MVTPADAAWGAFPWTVPETASSQCFVKVAYYLDADINDVSSAFSITSASVSDLIGLHGAVAAPPARMESFDMRGRLVDGRLRAGGVCLERRVNAVGRRLLIQWRTARHCR